MSKYYNDLILPTGDAAATFTKVAMADQMGRAFYKIAAKKVILNRLGSAIKKRKSVLKGLTNKNDILKEQKNIARLEGVGGAQRTTNKTVNAKTYKSPAGKKKASERLMEKKTGKAGGNTGKDRKAVGMHGKEEVLKTKYYKGKQRGRMSEVNKKVNPAKNTPMAPPTPDKKGQADWWKDERVWAGAAAGGGAALVGSAALS